VRDVRVLVHRGKPQAILCTNWDAGRKIAMIRPERGIALWCRSCNKEHIVLWELIEQIRKGCNGEDASLNCPTPDE
jgi:hypothetical protein